MKHTGALTLATAIFALAGCVHDYDEPGYRPSDDRAEARRACIELACDRGYRSVDVDSIDREGRDEWTVMLRGRDEGRNHRLRCEYQDRANRARLTELTR